MFVAGGIGITPFYSIVSELYARVSEGKSVGKVQKVHLMWASRNVGLAVNCLICFVPSVYLAAKFSVFGQQLLQIKKVCICEHKHGRSFDMFITDQSSRNVRAAPVLHRQELQPRQHNGSAARDPRLGQARFVRCIADIKLWMMFFI